MLADLALPLVGGTSLFRLVQTPAANALFHHLGEAGIWVRVFPQNAKWLRWTARQRGGLETAQGRARGLLVVREHDPEKWTPVSVIMLQQNAGLLVIVNALA